MGACHCRRVMEASLPSRGAWIEMPYVSSLPLQAMSLPSRGAWIEIAMGLKDGCLCLYVAPLTGSVD